MDHNFYDNDEFKEFLKQKADQYKMYPSDRVWNNIYSSLHGRKKWMITGFVLLFVFSSLFIGHQTIISNYTRIAGQINKVPEASFSAIDNLDKNKTDQSLQVNKNLSLQFDKAADPQRPQVNTEIKKLSLPVIDAASSSIINTPERNWSLAENGNNIISSAGIASLSKHFIAVIKGPVIPAVKPAKNIQADNEHVSVVPDKINSTKTVKPASLFVQFYGSPVVSYRRLYNDGRAGYAAPVSAGYGDNINKYVHHKPAIGFEAGSKILYKLSNSLSVYAGAQLNYSRYYIDAYKFHVEKASIALNDSRLDTLSGYTDIRNFSGYSPEQLQNQYWQLSVPLGVEIKLLGNKKLQLSVAGGIQPTFLIHSNSYLISSDYKNYIQNPAMARSFNVHTNFEAFLSYQTGGIKWQLGPQFRSQLLSGYSTQYRVREYLTEFGIKFGITKSLK